MKTFRHLLRGPIGRIVTAVVVLSTVHLSADPSTYLTVIQQQRQREDQIRAVAAKMNVDPEFLLNPQGRTRFDFRTLFNQLANKLGFESESVVANDQPADIREAVKRVKERYALVAADTVLARIAQLVQQRPSAKNKGQLKAELQSVLRLIDKDFLPPLRDDAPGTARSRDAEMRREIKELQKRVKSVINAPHALDEAHLEATLNNLRAAVAGTLTVRNSKPRWTRDPFPVKDTYRFANIKPASPSYEDSTGANSTTPAVVSQSAPAPSSVRLRPVTHAVSAEVTALANTLGTPAKIFTWVHDNIDWESYSGIAKGSLGTLLERRGNDWDQALLLRDLLAARGYNAQLEWGRVTLPVAKAMNLVGTEDPLQAANLLATAGFDGLVLTAKGQPVAIQMTHVWVRAHIPFIPDRGATSGTPDTWVRMDPSFKRYEYQPGIAINGKVQWNEDEYIQTSAIRPPAEFYGDKIWNYIRTNNIDCVNLSQVTKAGRIRAANYPFVPSTLTTKIDSVAGVSQTPPADQLQSVTMTITDINGAVMSTFTTSLAEIYGKKLSITFPPATSEDAATIASYGGLFNTPAYLIKLKPVFSIDDQPVADGSPVAAGAVLDLNTTFRQPNVADDFTHHELVAGETHAIVLDPGNFPDALLEARINRLKTLTNEEAKLSEKLFLVGLRYMQHVDDGIAFAAGVRWQRPVKRVFEADVRRQIDITYNVAGAAVRLTPAENNIDVSRLLVGIVPINNDLSNRSQALALAGLQSSYLEGAIWEEMESQQGISAAKALLLARMAGQQIHTVNAANVNAVLNAVNLSADVENEIRGAVAQGRIAKIPSANLQVNRWNGTGYILQDPQTGAATYPISGGLAGGSTTGEGTSAPSDTLGSEQWLEVTALEQLLMQILDENSERPPSTNHGDPVNLASGNMYRTVSDVSLPARGIPIVLHRTYNSRSTRNGPFGHGWTFSYGESVTLQPDGSALYIESDGTEHTFVWDGARFLSPAGKQLELTASVGGGYVIHIKTGAQLRFDARGLLLAQADRNGNSVTIQRDSNGLPTRVIDAAGRTALTFTASGGKIVEVTDVAGRKTVYGYNGDDLISVTDTLGKVWSYTYDLDHRMTTCADPLGNAQSFDYDSDGRLFHHVDATGAEEFFHYDLAARQSVVTDRRSGDRLVQFDAAGRATLEADPAGNVVKATFDAANNRTSVIDSRGFVTAYEYDVNGNITRQTNGEGGVVTTTYDAQSRPLAMTNELGVTTTYVYDSAGNLLRSSRPAGNAAVVTSYEYDAYGQPVSMTDPNGGKTTLAWNANGTLGSRTDAGGQTAYTTDAAGRVTSIKDPAGNETKIIYDAADRILSVTNPHGLTTSFTWDDAGRRTAITTPHGATRFTYDGEGRVLTTTDVLGRVTTSTYNAAGDVVARIDARGNTTRWEYDVAGRQTRVIDPTGAEWRYGYCAGVGGASGSFCDLADPNGNTVRREFDRMGRVVSITDAQSHGVFIQYDKAGRRTVATDANGRATRYAYDEAGRLTSVTEANGSVTSWTYDGNGNKLTHKDANGNVRSFRYDALNRLVEEKDPLGRATSYTYDTLGKLKTKTDAMGRTTEYTYVVERLTSVKYPDGSTDSYTYDALGRRIGAANANVSYTYTYDALGRIASVVNNRVGFKTQYEYDPAGNRSKLITPQSTVTYAWDAANRLTSMADTLFGTFRFSYDALGNRTETLYPNGVRTSRLYDKTYDTISIATKDTQGNVLDAWSYQYDAAGNTTARTDMSGKSDVFRYDDVNRLLEAAYADGTSEKFVYDRVGNRLSVTGLNGVTSYTYDVANQLLTAGSDTFTHDQNGNRLTRTSARGVTTTAYDLRNQVTSITSPDGNESNKYGPLGERMEMSGASIENGLVRPQYDLSGNPIADLDGSNGMWTYRLYAPGVDEPLAEWRRTNNRITFLHHDALRSVTAVTTTSGTVAYRSTYRAFGAMTRTADPSGIVSTRLGFTSRETSVGPLAQYRSRYYDSSIGRFLQADTVRGDLSAPQTQNLYAYVMNNPLGYTDPSGHTAQDVENVLRYIVHTRPAMKYIAAMLFFSSVAHYVGGDALTIPFNMLPFWMAGPLFPTGWIFFTPQLLESHPEDAGFLSWMGNIVFHELLHLVVAWAIGNIFYMMFETILGRTRLSIHEAIHRAGDRFGFEYQDWLNANGFNHEIIPDHWHGMVVVDFDFW